MSSDNGGLEKGRVRCDSRNTPVSMVVGVKVVDELSGNLAEYWCNNLFLDKRETAETVRTSPSLLTD